MLRLYNTLSRSLENFEPTNADRVGIYACGPTVYQAPHIGNFRTFVFNDLLFRVLTWKGFNVRFVMNLTDVDDKTIAGAESAGTSLEEFTEPVILAFFQDIDTLGIRRASAYPRATRHMPEMIELVERLLAGGHAYHAEDAVYFDISSFNDYGKLSRVDLGSVRAADRTRVTADEYAKEDARDFVLWKGARQPDRSVGAVWTTPWGEGRPGWHLECSAMSMAELGESFDIHTGGEDLIFPHHEDEIAQSEAATGREFARYWLHVKHLLVEGEKMSKSRGNFFTLRDLMEQGHEPAAIRYLLLSAHYRSELNFTTTGLNDARAALRRLTEFSARLAETPTAADAPASRIAGLAADALVRFEHGLDDDLNMPEALGALFTFVRECNAALDRLPICASQDRDAARAALSRMDEVLGCIGLAEQRRERALSMTLPEPGEIFIGGGELRGRLEGTRSASERTLAEWVEERVDARNQARAARDFASADRIRDELAGRGIVLEDTPHGTRWRVR